jgi:hypothetical protein
MSPELDGELPRLGFYGDPTQFGKLIDACFAAEPTITGRSDAAEGHLRFVVYCRAIDVTDP